MTTAPVLSPVQRLHQQLESETLDQLDALTEQGYTLEAEESEFRFHLNGTAIGELLCDPEEVAAAVSSYASGEIAMTEAEAVNRDEHEANLKDRLVSILGERGVASEITTRGVACERGVFSFKCGVDEHSIHEALAEARLTATLSPNPTAQAYLLLCCVPVKDIEFIQRAADATNGKVGEWEEWDAFPFDINDLLPTLAETLLEHIATIDTLPEFQFFISANDLQAVFDGGLDPQRRFPLVRAMDIKEALEACARRLGMTVASEPDEDVDDTLATLEKLVHPQTAEAQGLSGEVEDGRDNIPQTIPQSEVDIIGRAAYPVEELSLDTVRFDGGTQMRVGGLDEQTVKEYAAAIEEGEELPPGVVFFDGISRWCAAGHHRSAGVRRAGRSTFKFEVRPGKLDDAIFFAAGSNRAHGLRMKEDDTKRAVEAVIRDEARASLMSNREIARYVGGTTHTTVGDIRERLTGSRTPAKVTVKRGESSYTLDTANIGKNPSKNSPAEAPPEATDDSHSSPEAATAPATTEAARTESTASAGDHHSAATSPARELPGESTAAQSKAAAPPVAATPTTPPAPMTPSADPADWPEQHIIVNLAINAGKSSKRGITLSGRAGEGTPVFLTTYTLADLHPLPPPLAALVETLNRKHGKGAAEAVVAAAAVSKEKPVSPAKPPATTTKTKPAARAKPTATQAKKTQGARGSEKSGKSASGKRR